MKDGIGNIWFFSTDVIMFNSLIMKCQLQQNSYRINTYYVLCSILRNTRKVWKQKLLENYALQTNSTYLPRLKIVTFRRNCMFQKKKEKFERAPVIKPYYYYCYRYCIMYNIRRYYVYVRLKWNLAFQGNFLVERKIIRTVPKQRSFFTHAI